MPNDGQGPSGEIDIEQLAVKLGKFSGLESFRDQLWLVHLRWMFDNQPELVRELRQRDLLGLWVDRRYQRALELRAMLDDRGTPRDQAEEIVMGTALAPADGPAFSDDPPEPIPEDEQAAIEDELCPCP